MDRPRRVSIGVAASESTAVAATLFLVGSFVYFAGQWCQGQLTILKEGLRSLWDRWMLAVGDGGLYTENLAQKRGAGSVRLVCESGDDAEKQSVVL